MKTKTLPLTLLIDGDQFLYEVTSAHEVEADWGDDLWTLHTDLGACKKTLQARIEGVCKRFKTDSFIFCLSDDVNFRKEVLPSYKAKRKTVRKPLAYQALKKWAEQEYRCLAMPKLEADDVMGILATEETLTVSEDKDMKTIPGSVFRKGEVEAFNEAEADYWFLYQTLCGDVTDGYKGCPSIGDKTAMKILDQFKMNGGFDLSLAWEAVSAAFIKAGLTEEDALQQARCARILRASDWNAETQTVNLWTPTK